MRKALPFYTVLFDEEGYPVKYIDPDTWGIKRLSGSFSDPGEASQEFTATIGGENSCYLDPSHFQAKARALAKLRREIRLRERVGSNIANNRTGVI
jgi:hypothetical protein